MSVGSIGNCGAVPASTGTITELTTAGVFTHEKVSLTRPSEFVHASGCELSAAIFQWATSESQLDILQLIGQKLSGAGHRLSSVKAPLQRVCFGGPSV